MSSKGKILLSGSSGLLGTRLSSLLVDSGYEVVPVLRKPPKHTTEHLLYESEMRRLSIPDHNQEYRAFIHLGGAGIADQRWTAKRKTEILNSRTHLLYDLKQACVEGKLQIGQVISASGINYYPFTKEKVFKESDSVGPSFLSQVCAEWESAAFAFEALCPVATLRTAVVLSKKGGAFPKLVQSIKWGLGAPLGYEDPYFPWIHIEDLCRMYLFTLENQVLGPINALSGEEQRQTDLMRSIARQLNRPFFLPPVPGFILKIALGELSDVLLKGTRASADKIKQAGFEFQYSSLELALNKEWPITSASS